MKKSYLTLRTLVIFLSVMLIGFLLTACATGVSCVKLYDPLTYKSEGEEGIAYADVAEIKPITNGKIKLAIKKIEDKRPDITCIGVKKNTWGMKMGKVDVEKDIVFMELFKKHLIDTFELAGYEIVPIKSCDINSSTEKEDVKALIKAEIRSFWVEFMPGVFVVDAESDVIFEVILIDPKTNYEIWEEIFRGKGKVSSGLAVTRGMFEESINLAYAEAMKKFYKTISDNKIKDMLRK